MFSGKIRNAKRSGKLSEVKGTCRWNRGRTIGKFLQACLGEKAQDFGFCSQSVFGLGDRLECVEHEHLVQLSLQYIFLFLVQQFTCNFISVNISGTVLPLLQEEMCSCLLQVVSFLFQPCLWKFLCDQLGDVFWFWQRGAGSAVAGTACAELCPVTRSDLRRADCPGCSDCAAMGGGSTPCHAPFRWS